VRNLRFFLWIVLPVLLIAAVTCKEMGGEKPPLVVESSSSAEQVVGVSQEEEEEPLLLLEDDEGAEELPPPTGPVADNSRCHVCHINYADEELTVMHARANISCEQCHGACDAHCDDEDNITPPDIMYPKAKNNPFCMTCHPESDVSQWDACIYVKLFAKDNTGKMTCTTCHGKHRLNTRTRIWDKETGKLISDDGVRMMYKDSPANINPPRRKKTIKNPK